MMKKSIIFILSWLLLGSYAFAADTVREVLLQNAAVATGNGTAVTVDYFTTISVEVTITNTATITWEESVTGLNWNTGACVNASAPGTIVTTATASGLYHCSISALTQFRGRISAYTSGTVTAYARQTLVSFDVLRASTFPSTMVVTQGTGTNLHIVCDSGCGGAATFADNAAFTFGTTSINTMGAVVDDVGTNTVTENSAGAPRMNTNRILYTNPRNNAGTEIGTASNPIMMQSAIPVPPVLPPNLNRLQYATMMQSYCMKTLCPPMPGGFK